jgi:hypothetical protein
MSQQSFFQALYRLAEGLKNAPLTESERTRIVEEFRRASGSAKQRGTTAISNVLGISATVILEKRAALDDINRLITDVAREADSWEKEGK